MPLALRLWLWLRLFDGLSHSLLHLHQQSLLLFAAIEHALRFIALCLLELQCATAEVQVALQAGQSRLRIVEAADGKEENKASANGERLLGQSESTSQLL